MELIIDKALQIFKTIAPHRTGFLKSNIMVEKTSGGFILYIDEETVPYAKYTMDKWTHREDGRQNPNEDWQMEAGEVLANIIKHLLKAKVVSEKEE